MRISFIILTLTLNLFALEISKSKLFTKTLEPSFQASSFSVNYKSEFDYKIESKFKHLINTVERSEICKGGKYYIYPSYKYIENKRVQDGYRSNIRFTCEFKDIEKYETLLDRVKRLELKVNQGQISYKTTQKQKDEAKMELEKKAFLYSKSYIETLSDFFGSCLIKSINLSQNKIQTPPYRAMAMEAQSLKTTVTSPIKEDIKYNLNVDYVFKCTQ